MQSLTALEITQKVEKIGLTKGNSSFKKTLLMGIMGGMFISFGAIFAINTIAGLSGVLPYGLVKLIGGLVFSLGLILVVLAGGELFTGNVLLIIALLQKKIKLNQFVKNLSTVYLGNLIGSLIVIFLIFFAGWHMNADGIMGKIAVGAAVHKIEYGFTKALFLGILCNILVCLAIWLTYGAKSTADKILAIIFPITAFVALGFEHSVANMFYIPYGYILKIFGGVSVSNISDLNISDFLIKSQLPVTIGNFIGGTLFVGIIYWFVYLKKSEK